MGSRQLGLILPLIAALPACAPTSGADGQGGTTQPGGSGGGQGPLGTGAQPGAVGGFTGTGGSIVINPGDPRNPDPQQDAGCKRTASRPEQIVIETPVTREVEKPIDLYVMFDATLSTACTLIDPLSPPPVPTRWTAFSDAMRQFVNSPQAAGISVGLQYYPLQNDSCDQNIYGQPDVPIALLPGNAGALAQSLGARQPGGTTPINAAMRGAVQYARQWATMHPDHTVAIVFTTDAAGAFPCNGLNALAETNTAAADGFSGSPSIPTYVIGQVPGPNEPPCGFDVGGAPDQNAIHAIAAAGGTSQAILVQTGTDAAAQFLDALNQIRESITITDIITEIEYTPLPCEWGIPAPPEGEMFDKNKVNFEFAAGNAAPQPIGYVQSAADCAQVGAAWYYDNPDAPTKIHVCEQTCGVIQSTPDARVDIIFGCETEEAIFN